MPTKKRRSGSLTGGYRKQHGLHHKHSNKYLKVYWPYLPVFLLVMFGIGASIIILLNKPTTTIASSTISVSSLYNITNQVRLNDKLPGLTVNPELATAAQEKANDMVIKDYWAPVSPSGQTPWQVINSTGYSYELAGENLAYGFSDPQSILNAWLSSASHRANILNQSFQNVGFGVASSPNFENNGPEAIIVALYASPKGAVGVTNATSAFTSASIAEPRTQPISFIGSVTTKNSLWSILIVGILAGVIGCYLIIKNGVSLRKWAVESEEFVIKHPFLDVVLVVFLVSGASLIKTVGFIR